MHLQKCVEKCVESGSFVLLCFALLTGANLSYLYIHELTQEKEVNEVNHVDKRGKGRNKRAWDLDPSRG